MRSRKDYDLIVFYEDILSDKEKVCKELLKVCNIPSNYEPDVSDFLTVNGAAPHTLWIISTFPLRPWMRSSQTPRRAPSERGETSPRWTRLTWIRLTRYAVCPQNSAIQNVNHFIVHPKLSNLIVMFHGGIMFLPCLVPQVFSECGLTIQSRMGVAEFKEIVLSGSYAMRTELDSPDKKSYKRMGLFPK